MTLEEYLVSLNREFSDPLTLLEAIQNYHPTSPEDKLEKDRRAANLKHRIHKEMSFGFLYGQDTSTLTNFLKKK